MDPFEERLDYIKSRLTLQIRQKIRAKLAVEKHSIAYNTTVSQLNNLLAVFEEKLQQLKEDLNRQSFEGKLSQAEIRQRTESLNAASTLYKQLQDEIENAGRDERSDLLRHSANYVPDRPAQTTLTIEQARGQRQMYLQEQDKGFDTLGEIISKQRHMALDIGQEIEIQNEILDDIGDAMDETDQRLSRNTRNIRKVSVKANTCGLWVLIVLLFVADLVIAIL